jgi:hypothetical protein
MNKLLVSLTVLSILALFNTYSSFAQTGDKTVQTEKQSAKQHKGCATATKESCCKSEKTQPGNCCACCSGSTCTAKPDTHCCG